ncbi:MAG TPA: gliding motility protein GldL [Prevotella sp.]|nr:gliding motility protein GldL [Prevotella sp.]
MSRYSKYNLVYQLQKWMDTVAGQTFLNYAYSWGASIVILGALFKLTHLPGANVMLFIGMGTEVFVFFISAFDRPFDKTAEGREMPTRLTEEFLETGMVEYANEKAETPTGNVEPSVEMANGNVDVETVAPTAQASNATASAAPQQPAYVPQMSQEEADAMNEAQGNYVEELKTLVETLKKVNEQSTRLTRDSEEMENLNRTLTGISKVYEMQLKGASKQIGTIDEINAQTKKMAEQIDQLNKIYARMIEAMTVNMRAAAPRVNEE